MQSISKSKIYTLFELRLLSEQLSLNNIAHIQISDLALIQKRIYELDKYFESNWVLDSKSLTKYWNNINSTLKDIIGENDSVDSFTGLIKQYQEVEAKLRKLNSSQELSLLDFYTKKSCDIKLLRKIIQNKSAIPNDTPLWTYYDLATEINDDLTDFHEDLTTFNYNKYAIELLFNGKSKTKLKFMEFLTQLSKSLDFFSNYSNPFEKYLYQQTNSIIQINFSLLNKLSLSKMNPESSSLYKALKGKAVDNNKYDIISTPTS